MTYQLVPRDILPTDISQELYNAQLLVYALSCMRCGVGCMLMVPPPDSPRVTGDVHSQMDVLHNAWMQCLVMLHDDVATPHEREMVEGHPAFVLNRKWLNFNFDDILKTAEPDNLDHKDYVALLRYGGFPNSNSGLRGGGRYFLFTSKESMDKFEAYLGYKYPNLKGCTMNLIERLKAEREAALRAKDYTKRSVLGQLFDKAEKEAKKSNREVVESDIVAAAKKIIDGLNETRKFLIAGKAEREDPRHQTLNTEEAILTPYVPRQMTEEELAEAIKGQPKNKGAIMGFLKTNHSGNYDGATAARVADAYLKVE